MVEAKLTNSDIQKTDVDVVKMNYPNFMNVSIIGQKPRQFGILTEYTLKRINYGTVTYTNKNQQRI